MGKKREEEIEDLGDGAIPSRMMEGFGIVMLLFGAGLCFALLSFDPSDAGGGRNLVGPLGRQVARFVLGGVGVVGYGAGLLSVFFAGAAILGQLRFPSITTLLAGLTFTAGATILAHLLVPDSLLLGHPSGGVLGAVVAELLKGVVGPIGAGLAGVAAVLVALLGMTSLSLSGLLQEGIGWLTSLFRYGLGHLGIQRAAREAGATREQEMIEAARSRRARVALEREERERFFRESLEEKKRIAVLKATARAEERALKKIAEEETKERLEAERRERLEAESADLASEPPVEAGLDNTRSGHPASPVSTPNGAMDDEPSIIVDGETHLSPEGEEEADFGEDEGDEDTVEGDEEEYEEEDEDEEEESEWEESEEASQEDEFIDGAEALEEIEGKRRSKKAAGGPLIHARVVEEANFEGEDESALVSGLEVAEEKIVYQLPPVNLLDYEGEAPEPVDTTSLRLRATRLEEKLRTYGVEGKVTAIRPGPVVTTYEYQPAAGVKISKIANLSDDIAMSMEALRVRIVAPIPGRGVVGIELPNKRRENVYLKELIAHDTFRGSSSLLTMAMGKNAEGEVQVADLQKMPHLLIAGTTGSGKSVSINTMILSVLYKATPDQVKFIMVDPKMLELSLYADIPHLLLPVVTDPRKASLALQWAVDEMERRYQMLSDMKVRGIEGFNKRIEALRVQRETGQGKFFDPWAEEESLPEPLPYIVVLIDEFADLMCVAPRDVEMSVQRLAQKARAAGIHLLLATQRPSTDVITGVIKNNFPTRVSFRVGSRHDSSTILNSPGAENLLGMGDSLFLGVNSPTPNRIHGGYVSEDEVERVVDFWKSQAKPKYDENILKKREDDGDGPGSDREDVDEMYDQAVAIVAKTQKASISGIQRRLRVGYNRAARMVEMMEEEGVVGPASGPKGEREVLIRPIED